MIVGQQRRRPKLFFKIFRFVVSSAIFRALDKAFIHLINSSCLDLAVGLGTHGALQHHSKAQPTFIAMADSRAAYGSNQVNWNHHFFIQGRVP